LRPRTAPAREKVFDRHLISVASVTVLGTIMSILDTTIVNVALNSLVRSFHTTLADIQWVSTGYLLSLAMVIPLTRWIVDRYGTKRAWIVSVTMFLAGSLLCGLAWSSTTLIIFRVIQGLGGGMIMPIGQTIIAREAGQERLGRVMTVIGVPQLLGPMIGPVIGGLILSSFSWRWIFFVNIPIGLIALARARKVLPSDDAVTHDGRKLDFIGMLLLSPGMALLVYGLSEFGNVGHFDGAVLAGLGIGAGLIVAFILHALKAPFALLDLRLLKNTGFAMSTTTGFMFGAGMNAAVFLVPLYFQIARGYSPLKAALLMAPGGIGAMIAMPNAGKIMDKAGARRIVPFGLLVFSLAIIPFTMVSANTSPALLSFLWFVRGLGAGSTMTPTMAAGYSTLDRTQISGATTINNIANRVGASLGICFAAVVLQRRIISLAPGAAHIGLSKLNATQRVALAPELAHAFGLVFWFTVIIGAIAIVPAGFLPKKRNKPAPVTKQPTPDDAIGALAID
jgi:EmrB/QacA subfamily drug resistance transporter